MHAAIGGRIGHEIRPGAEDELVLIGVVTAISVIVTADSRNHAGAAETIQTAPEVHAADVGPVVIGRIDRHVQVVTPLRVEGNTRAPGVIGIGQLIQHRRSFGPGAAGSAAVARQVQVAPEFMNRRRVRIRGQEVHDVLVGRSDPDGDAPVFRLDARGDIRPGQPIGRSEDPVLAAVGTQGGVDDAVGGNGHIRVAGQLVLVAEHGGPALTTVQRAVDDAPSGGVELGLREIGRVEGQTPDVVEGAVELLGKSGAGRRQQIPGRRSIG